MTGSVVVLNPNSTEAVTAGLRDALAPLRLLGGPDIECATLAEGPPGIETDAHVEQVAAPVCEFLQSREADAGAFVIACFSDPGLEQARRRVSRPVFGMAECGYLTALTRGRRFGVISILEAAVERHRRYLEAMGILSRLAGDLPIGLGVAELHDESIAFERMVDVGTELRDDHGADVLVLGCAGMARLRSPMQDALGIAVVEPVQAAVTMALGAAVLS